MPRRNFYKYTMISPKQLAPFIGFTDEEVKELITILSGARVSVDVALFQNDMVNFESKDDVLTVLIHLGYLAYDRNREEVWIPNHEVREIFEKNLKFKNHIPILKKSKNFRYY